MTDSGALNRARPKNNYSGNSSGFYTKSESYAQHHALLRTALRQSGAAAWGASTYGGLGFRAWGFLIGLRASSLGLRVWRVGFKIYILNQ